MIRHSTHINKQKVTKRQYEISCNISTDYISENVQNKIYNFKIRLAQFTYQTKKAKKYSLVGH